MGRVRWFGSLRAAPVPLGAAVLCVGLGIGTTTTVFSAVYAGLYRPPPFPEPDRLVSVLRTTPFFQSGPFSAALFLDLRENGPGLERLSAFTPASPLLQDEGGSTRVEGWAVSGDFFAMLRVEPLIGRSLGPGDEVYDAPPTAVISEALWESRYARDPAIVGRTVRFDGVGYEVVGVAPRDLSFVQVAWRVEGDVWLPLQFTPEQRAGQGGNYLMLAGRLARGASLEAAHEGLRARMAALVEQYPRLQGEQLRVVGLQAEAAARVRAPLRALLAAVLLVLVVAAVDLAALLLVRGEARRSEWAVRAALGSRPSDTLRAAVRESLEITGLGTALGLLLAWLGVGAVGRMLPATLPHLDRMGLDPRVLAAGVLMAVTVGVIAALVPALQANRTAPGLALRGGGRSQSGGPARNRLLRGLVVGQVALSFMLLVGAGLFVRDLGRLLSEDPGFDPEGLLTLEVTVPTDRYTDGGSPRDGTYRPMIDAIEALPGVRRAGTVSLVPYVNWGNNFNARYEGQDDVDPATRPLVESRWADNGFFESLGMEIVEGRLFTPEDSERGVGERVIVNEALVARDMPDGRAVGRRFHRSDTTFATIVGVVTNVRNAGPFNAPRPEAYWPVWSGVSTYPLVVRTERADPRSLVPAIRGAILAVEPQAAIGPPRAMTDVIDDSLGTPRFYMTLMGAFAVTSLTLALAGLYGLISYVVASRQREIGIRIALGSGPGQTRRLVLGQGLALAGAGLALGAFGAAAGGRVVASVLHEMGPLDPWVWSTVPVIFLLCVFAALLVPTLRAQRIDPSRAMRVE